MRRASSDPTPTKPPNEAGRPAEEAVEGRGRTEGNSRQQNASRTPRRTDAPSALERVRQVARRDSKMRVTAQVGRLWCRALRRRGQRRPLTWARMQRHIDHWLPPPRVCHPYPLRRLDVIT
jgi:hypothetical protein